MKIISITTIKNESDIIESFVRYHSKIMDLMIILNNGSTDNSTYILNQLKIEGLPIHVINDEDRYFEPQEKYNNLLKIAINEFNADIVCPLDCDEFITCSAGNPRKIISNIPKNAYYRIKWKTYVPTVDDDSDELFIPKRIDHVRDESIERDYKIIITKELFNKFNIELKTGNHNILFDEKFKNQIQIIEKKELKIAHFPLRSVKQTMSKVLVNYPNTLSRKNVKKGISYHYTIMFNEIKKNGTISMDKVTEFAKHYSLIENLDKNSFVKRDIHIKHDPMNLDFCRNIEIKYNRDEKPLQNILNNYVYFAKEINHFKTKTANDEKQINALSNQLNQEKTQRQADVKNLNNQLNQEKTQHQADVKNLNNQLNQEKTQHQTDVKNLNNQLSQEKNKHKIEIENLNKNYAHQLETNVYNVKQEYIHQNNKLLSDKNYYNTKLKITNEENTYLRKKYSVYDKIISPIAYLYLLLKSKSNEISVNFKLYKILKNNDCFDLGYYLKRYPELHENKICNLFSPELHYVCHGFSEEKIFNSKCANFKNKKELIKHLHRLKLDKNNKHN